MEKRLEASSANSNGEPRFKSGHAQRDQWRVHQIRVSNRLSGHLALITGGGTGIGRAIATHMAAEGAQVVILGRTLKTLKETASELGVRGSYIVHDLSQVDEADQLVNHVVTSIGIPSILVNNAGEHLKRSALETTSAEVAQIMKTHVDGAFAMSNAVARAMLDSNRQDCSILFISSMASLFGIPGVAAYAAAKSAQLGLVRTLATEWSSAGIRVNSIAPGWIDTNMSRSAFAQDESRLQHVLNRTPMRRLGTIDEIARAATFLASSEASFITGVVLPVDGGASIGF